MEFLETIENIRAEEASIQRVFGSDGVRVPSRRGAANAAYKRKLAEAARFIAEVVRGARPVSHLQEAMTTSDFPLLTADIIDRAILGNYREWPKRWPSYLGRRTVRDFRTTKLFTLDGGEGYLSEIVPEMTEYPAAGLTEGKYELSVKKYGRRMPFSWELLLADDLGFFSDVPARMGKAAARTEDRLAVDLYVDANGPDATFFAAGNTNIVTGNPVLSITALQTALTLLSQQTDEDGEPIVVDAVTLVVPPALTIMANNIVNTTEFRIGTGSNTQIIRGNGLGANFKVVTEPYIPQIASTANGNTSWFLFADAGRPAATMAFLRGYEEPQVFVKEPNQRRINGGTNPIDGSFENDSTDYKVRHVVGGVLIDPKAAVASNGSGS